MNRKSFVSEAEKKPEETPVVPLPELLRKDDAVLVKASLGMHYDKVVEGIRQL